MKRFAPRGILVLAGILCLAAPTRGATAMSLRTLARDADRYDGKVITVVGTIAAYREGVTGAGSPYTAFRLVDGDASVAVFIWNKQGLGNGQRVRVTGAFERIRQFGPVEGEIQAHRIEPLP